jgi:quercetin dioxygenase-like cupin family protein
MSDGKKTEERLYYLSPRPGNCHVNQNISRVLITGDATEGCFSIVEQSLSPGTIGDRHMHTRESHSVEIVQGKMLIIFDSEVVELFPGDILHIPSFVWHRFEIESEATVARIILAPAGFEKYFSEVSLGNELSDNEIERKFGVVTNNHPEDVS